MRELNKYFVFSDVHGEYNALIAGLEEAGFDKNNPKHKLISVGDAFDRGPDSSKIFNFLRQHKATCVRGNHDNFFIEYLEKGMDGEFVLFNILHNGLGATIKSFTGLNDDVFSVENVDRARRNISSEVLKFMKNMPLYFETETFVFVHAGLNPYIRDWKETDEHYMLWDIQDSHKALPNCNKICVIGHHHAAKVRQNSRAEGFQDFEVNDCVYTCNGDNNKSHKMRYYGNKDENRPFINGNKIAIDGMTNLTGKVNVLVIEDYPLAEPEPVTEPEPNNNPDRPSISDIRVEDITWGYTPNFAQWMAEPTVYYDNVTATTTTWRG